MPGGKIVYVPMHPPKSGATETSSAGEWTIDYDELERAITPRTKMLVLNTPRKPTTSTSLSFRASLLRPKQTTPSARSTGKTS